MDLRSVCRVGDAAQLRTLLHHVPGEHLVRIEHGCTPLLAACIGGHDDCVELLLGHGAAADQVIACFPLAAVVTGAMGQQGSSRRKMLRCVELLLQHNADRQVLMVDDDGWTPFFAACRLGDDEIAQMLLRHIPQQQILASPLYDLETPLGVACRCGSLACVDLMLAHDPPREVVRAALSEGVGGMYLTPGLQTEWGAYRCLVRLIVHHAGYAVSFTEETPDRVVKHLLRLILRRVHACAIRIQRGWRAYHAMRVSAADRIKKRLRSAISNPEFHACKRRLLLEWGELCGCM
jgi:ankyrin repeat protein